MTREVMLVGKIGPAFSRDGRTSHIEVLYKDQYGDLSDMSIRNWGTGTVNRANSLAAALTKIADEGYTSAGVRWHRPFGVGKPSPVIRAIPDERWCQNHGERDECWKGGN